MLPRLPGVGRARVHPPQDGGARTLEGGGKAREGDKVSLMTPQGRMELLIELVEYPAPV